jgi:UPF0716 protein FxsA
MRALLLLVFVAIPLVELAIIIQVGQLIGVGGTILSLLAISLAGAALVKREGLRAVTRFREATAAGRWPTSEVVDGALLLVAGTLLLTPGYFTDAVGLLLLVPPSRAMANRALRQRARLFGPVANISGGGHGRRAAGDGPDGVVDVDVVDVRRNRDDDDDHGSGSQPRGQLGDH